jgi:Tol biopolymer transport system component
MRPGPFRGPKNRWLPWLVNGGIAVVLRAVLPVALDASGERYRYYAMSRAFPIPHCPSFHCFRALPPLFASLLPLETADALIVAGLVFNMLAAVVLFHLALKLSGASRVAWLTVLWYWATWAPILSLTDPLLITDPVQAFWSFTALYLLFDRRYATAFLMLVAGATVKESLLLVPSIYAACTLLSGDRERPSIAALAALAAAPIVAWVGFRFLLHRYFDYVVSEDVAYVRQTYFFGVWLKNLAPWPANLRLAALYIFGSFGAAWVFAVFGLAWSDRRQRALTAASIPAMVVLLLLQVPDRALASFPYAILIPAAIFTARLPAPLAAIVLLLNLAFTIRMNASVAWLPRTPVLLALLAGSVLVSAVLARRGARQHGPAPATDSAPERVRLLAWAALGLTMFFAARAAWHLYVDAPALRLALPADTAAIADDDGGTPGVAAAPDGRRIVFVGIDPSRIVSLYVRALTASSETVLEGTEGASAPFWSPDGERIAFFAGGKLKAITLATQAVDVLADAPHPRGGTWSRRGVIVYAPEATGGLYQVSGRGGQPQPATSADPSVPAASHRWPSFLPDGTRFLFVVSSAGTPDSHVSLGSLASSRLRPVVDHARSPIYADGLLVVEREGRLWTQPFDSRRETALGIATPASARVASSAAFGRAGISVGGATAVIATDTARSALLSPVTQLRWFDRDGRQLNVGLRDLFTSLTHHEWPVELANQVWLRAMRLSGVWAPDGERFAYAESLQTDRTLHTSVKAERVGSTQTSVLVADVPVGAVLTSWSPDGSTLFFHAEPKVGHGSWDIWTVQLPGGRTDRLIHSPANEVQAQLSPDGKWLAYASDETGRYEIFVQPYPPTGAKWQVSTEGGTQPRWRRDGQELFFVVGDRMLAAGSIDTTPAFHAGAPRELFSLTLPALQPTGPFLDYAVTPDGLHVLLNGPVGPPPSGRVAVWLNWRQGLTNR